LDEGRRRPEAYAVSLAAEVVRGGRNKVFDSVFSGVSGFFTVPPVFVVAAKLILALSVNNQ
jgi:ABC-type dipeptide/oligopeptide/nickel transport system permease component